MRFFLIGFLTIVSLSAQAQEIASYQFNKNDLNNSVKKAMEFTKMNLLFTSSKLLNLDQDLSSEEIDELFRIKCRETSMLGIGFEVSNGYLCTISKR